MAQALIVNPPFSPHDTSPPLGPAILAAHVERVGVESRQLDLNARLLARFSPGGMSSVVGDHAKDRMRVEHAREAFRQAIRLPSIDAAWIPDSVEPTFGLPHALDDVAKAARAAASDALWADLIDGALDEVTGTPAVVGISLMGPAQVVLGGAIAIQVRKRWPLCAILAGGSHVTLLREAIAANPNYGMDMFDAFMPHHCERWFADVCVAATRGQDWRSLPGVLIPGSGNHASPPADDSWLPPHFDVAEARFYDASSISLPLQLERGCGYGRCRFCTYPAVEGETRSLTAEGVQCQLQAALRAGAQRVSIKDSLMTLPAMRSFGRTVQQEAPGLVWSATTKIVPGILLAASDLAGMGLRTVEFGVETIHRRHQRVIDKVQSQVLIERVVAACTQAGIAVVLNLLYGLPDETEAEAHAQLEWFLRLREQHGGLVFGSHNLVEVNRMSPFALAPNNHGIQLGRVGPWAFSYVWNAPPWRKWFRLHLRDCTVQVEGKPRKEAA